MSSHVGRFVDVPKLVVAWLNFSLVSGRVVTVLPETIPATGVVWVAPVGGPSDWDEARVTVDLQILVPGDYGAAADLAEAGHAAMGALGGTTVSGQFVSTVECRSVPTPQYWAPGIDRLVGTYRLSLPVL